MARNLAVSAGVAVMPATPPLPRDDAESVRLAREVGFPVMLKADLARRGKTVQTGRRRCFRPQRRHVHDGDRPVVHVVPVYGLDRHRADLGRDRVAPRPPLGPALEGGDVTADRPTVRFGGDGIGRKTEGGRRRAKGGGRRAEGGKVKSPTSRAGLAESTA